MTIQPAHNTPILVTGAAGFIGFHVCKALLEAGRAVVGIDNLNDYYDVSLKKARLKILKTYGDFTFRKVDISNRKAMEKLWAGAGPFTHVIHLAAQAGVRYSLKNPYAYMESNCAGHLNILELCRHTPQFEHLVYASSSSVYGGNTKLPYSVQDRTDQPISLYAATKRSVELMSHSYSHLYGIPQTGLRFFTVYGPWGRPDMAYFIFTKRILAGQPIDVFNSGDMKRDFTYIDDIVAGVLSALDKPPHVQDGSGTPHKLYNIGNNSPEDLMHFIHVLEDRLGKKATINNLPMQDGDVHQTYAEITEMTENYGFKPTTSIDAGLSNFVDWYKDYYKIS